MGDAATHPHTRTLKHTTHPNPPKLKTNNNRPSSIFEYISSDMLVGGSGAGGSGKQRASVRRARLLHLIPLLALLILVLVKLMN